MDPLAELIGESAGIVAIREKIRRLVQRQSEAHRLAPILLQGDTGTGKGLLVRAIHRAGPRAAGPFVDVNCAAIPETLLEAELFGFERGAFTDARQAKAGLFQVAHRGTIFLDEVGLFPERLQAKLLTVIEERTVRRLGSTRSEPADVWILSASNEDLAAAVRARRFREDLYHRLAVLTLWVPPLRERGQDVLLLAEHFLTRACADYGLTPKAFTADARAALLAYPWPGNIRELANVLERVALLVEGPDVSAEMLGLPIVPQPEPEKAGRQDESISLEDAVRTHLLEVLYQTNWNISRAAARLGISRNTLRARIEKHGLRPGGSPAPPRRRATRPESSTPAVPVTFPAAVPVAPGVRWEQRRLTLLRAILVLPPTADFPSDTSRALDVLVEKIQSFGGRVEELSPTGILATFGHEPIEDAPRRAALTALAIQKAVERARGETVEPLMLKIGIHTGQFMMGQVSGTVSIEPDAKREAEGVLNALVERAEPNSILVSQSCAPLLERHFELLPLGALEQILGQVFRLAGREQTGLGLGGRMTKFVGRRHELELLRSLFASAQRGHGQVVGIVGGAGVGKSRLLYEFRQSLAGEWVTYLEGRCVSYGSSIPYLGTLDILRQNFRISETDSPEAIAEKVRAGLQDVGMDPEESAPYLLGLLGVKEGTGQLEALSPGAIKVRTFEALRQMVLNGSQRRPIIFVVEDLHWVDTTLEECLVSLMESTAGVPALLLCTYRPGYRPPWVERSYVTQVALQALSPEESLSVVRSVLRRDDIPDRLAQVILEKAEGNPFFLEELARAVGEAGELRPPAAVPDTIQEVLLARMDRLPEESKRLLQTASVIGREVPLPLLQAIWESPGELDPHLRELARLEFLYKQSGGVEPVYAFTHTLTQEVAYESLPTARRRALHAAAAQALEAIYQNRLEKVYDRLAYHYSKTERADKAVEHLTRLAEIAARGHAHTEAVQILGEALAHVDRLGAAERNWRRLDLLLRQAYSLIPLGRFQDIVDLLVSHQAEFRQLQDPLLSGNYHYLLGRNYFFLGDDELATRHAEMGIAEATRCGDEATLGRIHYVLAQQGILSGRPHEGLEHGRQAAAFLERAGERWWIGPAYWATGLNHAVRGEFEAALEAEGRAAAMAEIVGDPELQTSTAWATGMIYAVMGDREPAIVACQRSLKLAPDPLNTAIALGWLGCAYLESGDPAQAIPMLEQAVEQVGQFRFAQLHGLFTAFLAEAYGMNRDLERAHAIGLQGLAIARRAGSRYAVGWAQRALGRIAHASDALPEADTHFQAALQTFDSIQARFEVGRTHLAVAALAYAQGNLEATTRHLREARRMFTALKVQKYIERTVELAANLGVSLSENVRQ